MTDEQTNATDTQGNKNNPADTSSEEVNKPSEVVKSPSQALKEENDALEKELLRAQKIKNEQLLAGTTGGHVEPEVKEETPKEYRDRIDKEILEGKHND